MIYGLLEVVSITEKDYGLGAEHFVMYFIYYNIRSCPLNDHLHSSTEMVVYMGLIITTPRIHICMYYISIVRCYRITSCPIRQTSGKAPNSHSQEVTKLHHMSCYEAYTRSAHPKVETLVDGENLRLLASSKIGYPRH